MFPKGIGMKLMAKILGYRVIASLISALTKFHFKAHPLNAGSRVPNRCNHDNRFIHESVKMYADLSGITFDETRKGGMQIAVVVGDPLLDLRDYIEGQLSNVGKKTKQVEKKKIFTNIYQKLKGVDDEDTRRILNTFGSKALSKCYANILSLAEIEREEYGTVPYDDMITAVVTATSTQ
jgi:hypothetical protein